MYKQRCCILLVIFLAIGPAGAGFACAEEIGNTAEESSELTLQEVWLHSTGKGYFVYKATVEQETEFTIPVRSDEVSDMVRHAFVIDPESNGRATIPSKPDPQTPRVTLPNTRSLVDLLLSMRGQVVSAVDHEGKTIRGRLVALELRTEFVEKQKINFEMITFATEVGLRSLRLDQVQDIATDDEDFNDRLNMALDRMIADDSIETTEVTIRFESGSKRQVQVHLLREMPIWKVSYLSNVDQLLLRATVDNTTSEDWDDVRVVLKTGSPMNFAMDVASIVRAKRPSVARPMPSLRVAPTLAESNEWTRTPEIAADEQDAMDGIFGGGGSDPFGGDGSDPFGPESNRAFGGSGGMGGGMGGRGVPGRRPNAAKENLLVASEPGESASQAAGAALVVTFDAVDLPAGKMILLDTPIEKVNGQIVSVYRAKDSDAQPMLSLKIRPEVAFVLPAGPLTVFSEETNYDGEAIMPAITPGVDRLIPFAIDQAVRVQKLPVQTTTVIQNVELLADKYQLKYQTLTVTKVSYRIDNRDVAGKTVLLEHPKPNQPTEVVINDDGDTEQTEDAIRFNETVPAGTTVQRDVIEQRLDKQQRSFSEISSEQLEKLIGDASIAANIRSTLNEVLKHQNQRSELKDRLNQMLVTQAGVTKEIERITRLLRPANDQGNGLSEALQQRYESRVIELENKRDGLIGVQAELNEQLQALEQSLGIKQSPKMNRAPAPKVKNQRQQKANQGGIF